MRYYKHRELPKCFNTQPPEGGCECLGLACISMLAFQHTAA